MTKADGAVKYEVRADNSKIKDDLNESNKIVEKESSKLGKTAGKAAKGIGIALATATVAAIKFGSDFEQSFANASTLFGDVAVDVDNLQSKILDLSDESGIAADELNKGLYSALSAGVPITEDASEAMEFMEGATKLAKAGFTDIDTAISATAKTLNSYGLDMSEAERIQGILINTQNLGITTVDELGSVLSNVTPVAAAAGVSFEEVGAALALMTSQGTPAAQATTQLNSAISSFLKPNKEMQAGLVGVVDKLIKQDKIVGKNAETFTWLQNQIQGTYEELENLDTTSEDYDETQGELLEKLDDQKAGLADLTAEMGIQVLENEGLQGALSMLNEEFDGSANQMAKALGSTEALKASLAITGENAAKFEENLASMNNTTGMVDEAFKKVSDTTKERFNKNINELKNVLIEVFLKLQEVTNAVFDFIDAVKAGETWIKLLATVIGTITALVIAYNIQQALATANLTIWGAIAAGAATATSILAGAFAFLTSPIGIIILAIGALIAIGILLVENWDAVSEFLSATWKKTKEVAMSVWNGLKNFFSKTVTAIGDGLKKGFGAAIGFVEGKIKVFTDVVKTQIGLIKDTFKQIIDFVKNVFAGNWSDAWENVKNIFSNVWESFKTLATLPLNYIIGKINGFLGSLNNIKLPDWVPGVGGKSFNISLIPKLAKGGLAFGETMSVVGDNPNANVDPEVIAPLSKLKSMMLDFLPMSGLSGGQQAPIVAQFNGTLEVDGVELAEVTLNNIDEARQFI